MIAVFWDRLNMQMRSDGVFTYFDALNSRFCIEWSTGIYNNGNWSPNIFEVILFDPEAYPTPTGDSQILFQYNTVNNIQDQWEANEHCSVGISSPEGMDGLTYTYWDEYAPSAARLANGRAILWTTISYAPGGTIFGQVTRWVDSTAVAGAHVETSNGSETITRHDGTYRLWNIEAGTIDITVSAEHYGDVTVEDLELEEDGEIEQDFVLPHAWLGAEPDTIYFEIDENWEEITEIPIVVRNYGGIACQVDSFAIFLEGGDFGGLEGLQVSPSVENFGLDAESEREMELIMEIWCGCEGWIDSGYYECQVVLYNDSPAESFVVPLIVNALVTIPSYEVDEDDLTVPKEFALSSPYPNPFNSMTTISFALPRDARAKLALYDLSGRIVTTLTDTHYRAGNHLLTFDAGDLPTGLYLIKMEAGDFSSVRRVLLIR